MSRTPAIGDTPPVSGENYRARLGGPGRPEPLQRRWKRRDRHRGGFQGMPGTTPELNSGANEVAHAVGHCSRAEPDR
jgi:hypothetical protein